MNHAFDILQMLSQIVAVLAILCSLGYLLYSRLHLRGRGLFPRARPTVRELMLWSLDFDTSCAQIQKAYDWEIAQWSNMANATLAAMFGFLTPAVIELFKKSIQLAGFGLTIILGAIVFVTTYIACRLKIERLRSHFLATYSLLVRLK